MVNVYLEIGKKRTFAGALGWPGWARSGRDEASALQALLQYAPRYAGVVRAAQIEIEAPAEVSAFNIVERLEGNATTDFGAPGIIPSSDSRPVEEAELHRLQAIMEACWGAFDRAVQEAAGKELRKGPRGGGREMEKITQHVLGACAGYLSSLGWKLRLEEGEDLGKALARTRQAVQEALAAAGRGELPTKGPRGGALWPPRYFVRRSAWHVLDHTWEIEYRILE